ncbi:carbohydrate ABC transporter permease [Atrimonas thermophila]|uniref:carbohydrate ABC transporter permease n=1 Tax=Atrimonas thermophila TaxID=3064161 RepID=UPI00399C6048
MKIPKMVLFLFLLPSLALIFIFGVYPVVYNVFLSLKDVNLISYIRGTAKDVGSLNYKTVLGDSLFWRALYNTIIFTLLSIALQMVVGFLLALLFNYEFPLKGFLQALVMIPWVMPIMVSGSFFRWFLNDNGFLNNLLASMNWIREPVRWITSEKIVIYSLTAVNVWLGIPFNFILLYTGMQQIPEELYESAEIDGAAGWQKVLYITLPMLKPVIVATFILGCILTFKVFDLVWIVTRGGPGGASHLLSTFSYSLAFDRFQFGKSAAVLVLMQIIVILFVGFSNRIRLEER